MTPSSIVFLALVIAALWSAWLVVRKAGYSGWQTLLIFVPVANLVWLVAFASTDWPVERELAIARVGLRRASRREEELAFNTALRCQRRGRHERAQDIYALLAQNAAQPELVNCARAALQTLRPTDAG